MTIALHPEAEGKIGAPLPSRCHSCTALAVRQKEYKDSEHSQALKFHTIPYTGLVDHIRRVDGITEPDEPGLHPG